MSERNKVNQEGILNLEQSLLRTSLEQLKRAARNAQKIVEKGVADVAPQVAAIAADADTDRERALAALQQQLARLEGFKKRLAEVKADESWCAKKTRARLEHLNQLYAIPTTEGDAFRAWSRVRLQRLLVDYLLRCGFYDSALMLAKTADIVELVDVECLQQARAIEVALAGRSCRECLQWCLDNKSALRKLGSELEINLRLQEYVELVRQRRLGKAIAYMRRFLAPFAATHMPLLQEANALLAYNPAALQDANGSAHAKYQAYFSAERWTRLILEFRADHHAFFALPRQPQLVMMLQAGLAALKTSSCAQGDCRNVNCPVCDRRTYGRLAERLPSAHHVNSCIVCRISGDIMNEDNPPLALPNGHVYSRRALQAMADASGDGRIVDPETHDEYELGVCRKVHVL